MGRVPTLTELYECHGRDHIYFFACAQCALICTDDTFSDSSVRCPKCGMAMRRTQTLDEAKDIAYSKDDTYEITQWLDRENGQPVIKIRKRIDASTVVGIILEIDDDSLPPLYEGASYPRMKFRVPEQGE